MLHIFHGFSLSFLPSFLAPPWPHGYLLAADHDQQQGVTGWPVPPFGARERNSPPSQRPPSPQKNPLLVDLEWLQHLEGTTSGFSRRPSQIMRRLKAPTGRPRGARPPTYRPGFNVAMKETFYCRLQTAALSQLRVVHAIICEGRRGLVLIRAVKWRRSDRLLTSVEAEFIELAERERALLTRRDANTEEKMLEALFFHMTCHQQQFSPGSQQTFAVLQTNMRVRARA